MMNQTESLSGLVLSGLDGGNPLAFLAAIGTVVTAQKIWPDVRICWRSMSGGWRPVLTKCGNEEEAFLVSLHTALHNASMTAFEIDGKLPFPVEKLIVALNAAARAASFGDRRTCDFLAAFGTEIYPKPDSKKVQIFQGTRLRMVRSGDSKGQGLPVYAKVIRKKTGLEHLRRTLFRAWDYADADFSLRWDPIEDQRYALRWRDPSKSGPSDGPSGMLGANSLAVEALQWFPTVMADSGVETTGFHRNRRREVFFTWPIWSAEVRPETVRSLLALGALHEDIVPRDKLAAMGIVEVFRSQRIQQNQYYSNFAPSRPA
jgi:hypothetical protein